MYWGSTEKGKNGEWAEEGKAWFWSTGARTDVGWGGGVAGGGENFKNAYPKR